MLRSLSTWKLCATKSYGWGNKMAADYKEAYEFLTRRVLATAKAMRNPRLAKLPYSSILAQALINADAKIRGDDNEPAKT